MASGDIHYRSLVALLPAGLARWSRHESWGMIHEIEVGNPSCRDLHNFTRSQIIWSAWKPNYVFRRRFPIDVQTKSLATLVNKYLAKSWWSNGQKSGMTRCWRAMILRWSGIQQVMALDDPRLHTAHLWILPVPRPARTGDADSPCRLIVIISKLRLTIL